MAKHRNKDFEIKTIRLEKDLIQKIDKLADVENRNFSNMTETLLLDAIGTRKTYYQQQV